MIYAQLNEENICIGISQLSGKVAAPTEHEIIQAELLLDQAEIIAKQNEHDEVLAEILLGQQEVQTNV